MKNKILVIDDEEDILTLVTDILSDEGFNVRTASDSMKAFQEVNKLIPDVIILDIWLQGSELDGLGILEILVKQYPYIPIIMISGHGTISTAVNAIKMGAYDYIEKPFSQEKILIMTKRASEVAKLTKENKDLKLKFANDKDIIGSSSSTLKLKLNIEKIAPTSSRIFITGPSGSGKKRLAEFIHLNSKRKDYPFLVFNPVGKSPEDMEFELFGNDFSKAINFKPRKMGIFELANKGTLLLENIEHLPLIVQNKILHFIQNQIISNNNSQDQSKLDVRIISSSSKDLKKEIEKGKFREDLYYRLQVIPVELPPLCHRREDIPFLIKYFLDRFYKYDGYPQINLEESTIAALQSYHWPGNIRQLNNTLEWLLIMYGSEGQKNITPSMLPSEILVGENQLSHPEHNQDLVSMKLREAREIFEIQYLTAQLARFNGNISKMSKAIGMERSALHRKLKSLELVTYDDK